MTTHIDLNDPTPLSNPS